MTVRRQWVAILQQEEYLLGLRELQTSMERSRSTGHSATKSKWLERLVLKIIAAEEKLYFQYEQLEEMESRLTERIRAETTEPLRSILIYRYVRRQTWTEISKGLDKSRREIYRIHKKFASQLDAHRFS